MLACEHASIRTRGFQLLRLSSSKARAPPARTQRMSRCRWRAAHKESRPGPPQGSERARSRRGCGRPGAWPRPRGAAAPRHLRTPGRGSVTTRDMCRRAHRPGGQGARRLRRSAFPAEPRSPTRSGERTAPAHISTFSAPNSVDRGVQGADSTGFLHGKQGHAAAAQQQQ